MGLAKIAGKKLAEKATEGALASVAKQARAIGKKGDVIPPPFERAPAKTKEEIDAIARRVAPQLTGEFVRLDPTKSINPAGLSKKRFDIEKELEHDIRPVREVAPPSMFDYESNLGKVQLGVFGDPTISQQDIYSIAGRKLPIPSRQYGGPRYPMYEPEDAWASNFGAASGLQSSAERASKQYGGADVIGLYTKMGKDSYGFAQHLSDALMKNIMISLPDMSKKQIAGFNKMVRNNPDAKDFAGIENPDIALAQMEKNPEMRKQFSMLATTPTYTKAFNMPNGLDVVHAVLEPDLRNLERGMTGYTAIELDPNVTHLHATDRASTTTYDTRIPRKEGAEVQQLEALTPYDLQYPDQLLAISKNPKQAPQPFGTLMMSGARQIIDPQHIDEIGLYRDFIKKYTGKKKGGSVEKDPEQIRDMIKSILGSDIEKADGGTITTPEIEVTPNEKLETLKEVPRTGKISGKIADILKPASRFLEKYQIIPEIPLIGGADLADITGVKGVQTLAEDMSYGYKPIRNLERGKLQTSYFDPRMLDAADLAGTAVGVPILAKNLGKTAIKEGMRQIQTGEGMLGRNVMNPRQNIIKDQGGMLVGGEKALDDELIAIKRNERPGATFSAVAAELPKDANAVALNQWIDTKVKKYIRNQAGTEADPILKTIESGVDYNFTPPQSGDTKYTIAMKRKFAGKDPKGIATTEKGKDWEYAVDSIFNPVKSSEIKDILQRNKDLPPSEASDKFLASVLRTEHDLPVYSKKDLDALQLINQIPDETVYGLNPAITNKLGLDHMTDVLMGDLRSGKLKPEQLNQMSIEKAIRRTAEYDAEKAKAMAKANASSIEGMPIPKEYDDGYKWVELKHETDPKRTELALKSEGEVMAHCVGDYCPDVESGEKKIYSLRGPDGKSYVTIEARPQFSMTLWRNANMDAINSNPKLKEYDFNMRSLDNDHKYGYRMTERDYVTEMTKEMRKLGINPVEPPSYMEIHQVKGRKNKRPDDKYQSYISDFIKNNPTKHEIVEVFELDHTNLMGVQNIADSGLVPPDIHFHPDVLKATKARNPKYHYGMSEDQEEMRYDLFKEVARDFARKNKNYVDKDDILNHIREKYLTPPKKAEGGSINLNQEYKLETMRRRYG